MFCTGNTIAAFENNKQFIGTTAKQFTFCGTITNIYFIDQNPD